MLVGEQPGDVRGPPRRAIRRHAAAGCWTELSTRPRSGDLEIYLTTAVKHFRWKATGTDVPGDSHARPAHLPDRGVPSTGSPESFKPIRPTALVRARIRLPRNRCSAQPFRLTQHRGEFLPGRLPPAPTPIHSNRSMSSWLTVHPSAVLRADDQSRRETF